MLKKYFYLLALLFTPAVALAETDKAILELNKKLSYVYRDSIISGFFNAFKLLWPYFLITILIKIAFIFLEKKIKNWKKKNKVGKL